MYLGGGGGGGGRTAVQTEQLQLFARSQQCRVILVRRVTGISTSVVCACEATGRANVRCVRVVWCFIGIINA